MRKFLRFIQCLIGVELAIVSVAFYTRDYGFAITSLICFTVINAVLLVDWGSEK